MLRYGHPAAYRSRIILDRTRRTIALQVSDKHSHLFTPVDPYRLGSAAPNCGNHVTLPSFDAFCRTLERPGCGLGPQLLVPGDRNLVSTTHAIDQRPTSSDVSSAAQSHTLSASPPASGFTQSNLDSVILANQDVLDGDVDKFSSDPRARALAAKTIVHHHFGQLSWSDLMQIKADVDSTRPLFGSDTKSDKRGTKSTKKHSEAERDRRCTHKVMQQEQGRRMPNRIMELALYPLGSRKSPGKHNLYVASLLMSEFDSLLQTRMQHEILNLRLLCNQGQEHISNSYRRRSSSTPEDDASSCESPRKRKRYAETMGSASNMPSLPSPSPSSTGSQSCLSARSGSASPAPW